jgi:hypothetical protein
VSTPNILARKSEWRLLSYCKIGAKSEGYNRPAPLVSVKSPPWESPVNIYITWGNFRESSVMTSSPSQKATRSPTDGRGVDNRRLGLHWRNLRKAKNQNLTKVAELLHDAFKFVTFDACCSIEVSDTGIEMWTRAEPRVHDFSRRNYLTPCSIQTHQLTVV